MTLKIIKASEPIIVSQIVVCIYAPPGIGKTSTGFTADKAILLDADDGAYRSGNRGDSVPVKRWQDIDGITEADLLPYNTVVVDTAGRALDWLTANLIRENGKFKGFGGALTLQGYGALKTAFVGWLNMLRSHGKDVVLLAHMDEQHKGDEIIERLDVQGGSKAEIYKSADAMGRLKMIGKNRVLDFSPSEAAFGKNPAQLDPITVPNFTTHPDFLAGIIADTKAKLNAGSEAATKEQSRLAELQAEFGNLETAKEFTKRAIELVNAKETVAVRALLNKIAMERGFVFDKEAKAYKGKAKPVTAASDEVPI
jgi:hypothetical protein